MTDQVEVRPTDLVTHAANVEAIGDRVITARQAGGAVQAGSEAYGRLCTMVPFMLNVLQDILIHKIDETADSLHATGSRLRTAAQSYEETDQRRGQVFDRINGGR
jgi:hypothetical protein